MPADPAPLDVGDLGEAVRRVIADVLMVPIEKVRPESALSADLGAESIDYVDLVFRLDDTLGRQIPLEHWTRFLSEKLRGRDLSHAITAEVVRQFAEIEAAS